VNVNVSARPTPRASTSEIIDTLRSANKRRPCQIGRRPRGRVYRQTSREQRYDAQSTTPSHLAPSPPPKNRVKEEKNAPLALALAEISEALLEGKKGAVAEGAPLAVRETVGA
jgi:hypothetical protein